MTDKPTKLQVAEGMVIASLMCMEDGGKERASNLLTSIVRDWLDQPEIDQLVDIMATKFAKAAEQHKAEQSKPASVAAFHTDFKI